MVVRQRLRHHRPKFLLAGMLREHVTERGTHSLPAIVKVHAQIEQSQDATARVWLGEQEREQVSVVIRHECQPLLIAAGDLTGSKEQLFRQGI